MVALGPGVFTLAAADYSCLVDSMTVETAVDVAESKFKLCGTERPGVMTFTGTLTGTVDQDIDVETDSLFEFLSVNGGTVQAFTFEPSTAAGLEVRGSVLVTPSSFGGDEYGVDMSTDLSFNTIGDLTFYRGGTIAWVQNMQTRSAPATGGATGATAGTPGTFTPSGSTPPANLAGMTGLTASPGTAWTTGQYVATGDAAHTHWTGSAWATGDAP